MCKTGDKSSPFLFLFFEILLRKILVFYHKLHTTWVEERFNTLLKESDGAIEKPGEITSYEYVRTEKLENSDIIHMFKKISFPIEKPVEKVKEAIATGVEANPIISIMATAGTLSAGLFAFFKKKK